MMILPFSPCPEVHEDVGNPIDAMIRMARHRIDMGMSPEEAIDDIAVEGPEGASQSDVVLCVRAAAMLAQ